MPPCRSVRGLAGVAADGLDRAFGIHPAWPCEVRTQFFIKTLLIPVLGGASSLQSVSSILHAVPIISPGYGPHADMQGGPKKLHLRCEHSGQTPHRGAKTPALKEEAWGMLARVRQGSCEQDVMKSFSV